MIQVKWEDNIRASLVSMEAVLKGDPAGMDEIGQLMVTWIRESHDAQRGLEDNAPYAPVTARYAKAKLRAGGSPGRVLFGPSPGSGGAGGNLFASWGVVSKGKWSVTVGATGGRLNKVKASAHDGGLAQYLGRPELNRLRLGWTDKRMSQCVGVMLDKVMKAGYTPGNPSGAGG